MRYITIKPFERKGICGPVNIPYGSVLEKRDDGQLYYDGKPICVSWSAASHTHFAYDGDGKGQERGRLSHAIIEALEPQDGETRADHNKRWEPIWKDPLAQRYRKPEHLDYWLWHDNFFKAPIEDLEHIATLAGVGKG